LNGAARRGRFRMLNRASRLGPRIKDVLQLKARLRNDAGNKFHMEW